jgi:hypothetical protein
MLLHESYRFKKPMRRPCNNVQQQKCETVRFKDVCWVSVKVRLSPMITRGMCVFGMLSRKW